MPGTSAVSAGVCAVAVYGEGNVCFTTESAVLRVDAITGILSRAAGNATRGFSGDNGSATSAQLNTPDGVAVDSAGNLYITDFGNQRIRKVSGGVITTLAAEVTSGFRVANRPATSAQLSNSGALAL